MRDVVVNLHHLPDSVIDAIGTGRRLGVRISYAFEREILGTGGGPRAVREFLGREPFLLVNGDVFFDFDLRALVARHRASGALATLALRRLPDPRAYSAGRDRPRGRILSIAGRPRAARGPLSMFASVHVLDPRLLERLPAGPSDSVRDLYMPLLAEGAHLAGSPLRGRVVRFRPSLALSRCAAADAARGGRARGLVGTRRADRTRGASCAARCWARGREWRRTPASSAACCGRKQSSRPGLAWFGRS